MQELTSIEDIQVTTTLRMLKKLRKKLKKEGNNPFSLNILETRIKQLQDKHLKKVTFETTNKLIKFLKKVVPK